MHYLQHHEKGDGVPGDGNDLVLGDELQPLLLRQCVLRRPLNGAFDGIDCVAWENGDKWHRLSMSFAQWELLSRRRYVPSSIVLAAYVYDGVRSVLARIAGKGSA